MDELDDVRGVHAPDTGIDLLWIPLGAGQHVVRVSGGLFEALSACAQRRPRCALYHSALVLHGDDGPVTIEVAPSPDGNGAGRGVVIGGPVGTRWLGRFRVFRYEVRCWPGGAIPDAPLAASVEHFAVDDAHVRRIVALTPALPAPVWGRDELHAGEMWNSNSVISWLLATSGLDLTGVGPPHGGRAPGWDAGLVVAQRHRRPP